MIAGPIVTLHPWSYWVASSAGTLLEYKYMRVDTNGEAGKEGEKMAAVRWRRCRL